MADTDDAPRPLPDLLSGGATCMVVTPAPDGLASRPVTLAEATPQTLRFLVDTTADWARALELTPTLVNVAFADTGDNTYVSVTGNARLDHDRAEAQRLWNPAAKVFFDGPDDPKLAVLEVDVERGQWWDGPNGRLRQAVALVKTAVTRNHEDAGDQGELDTTASPQST